MIDLRGIAWLGDWSTELYIYVGHKIGVLLLCIRRGACKVGAMRAQLGQWNESIDLHRRRSLAA